MTRMLVALCALTVAGCGGAAKIDPRAEYQKSLDDYQACINSNLKNLQICEAKRVAMETNERAHHSTTTGTPQRGNTKDDAVSQHNVGKKDADDTVSKGIVAQHPEPVNTATSSLPLHASTPSSPLDASTSSSSLDPPKSSSSLDPPQSSSPREVSPSSPMPF
jgi:hypothetical protein